MENSLNQLWRLLTLEPWKVHVDTLVRIIMSVITGFMLMLFAIVDIASYPVVVVKLRTSPPPEPNFYSIVIFLFPLIRYVASFVVWSSLMAISGYLIQKAFTNDDWYQSRLDELLVVVSDYEK